MARFVMALDQGTTSSRAILFDARGAVVAVDQHEFTQHFPKPGWVEHDAEEIWETQLRAARGVLLAARATGRRRRRDRHHEPARDDGGVGPQDRAADPPRDRLAVAADGADSARSCAPRARGRGARAHRAS